MAGWRRLGLLLLTAGFFGAAFVTVRHADSAGLQWNTVPWGWYGAAFLTGAVGVVLLRVVARRDGTQAQKLDADMRSLERSLDSLVGKLRVLNSEREQTGVYDVHRHIDDRLVEDLGLFVEARESLIHRFGLQQYADLMSRFAAAERNINRAWAASADGYVDEVRQCLDRALGQMTAARTLLTRYQTNGS